MVASYPAQIMMTGHTGSAGSWKLLLCAFLMEPSIPVCSGIVSSMPVVRPRFTRPVSANSTFT